MVGCDGRGGVCDHLSSSTEQKGKDLSKLLFYGILREKGWVFYKEKNQLLAFHEGLLPCFKHSFLIMARIFSLLLTLAVVAVAFGFRATMKMGEYFVFFCAFRSGVRCLFCSIGCIVMWFTCNMMITNCIILP